MKYRGMGMEYRGMGMEYRGKHVRDIDSYG